MLTLEDAKVYCGYVDWIPSDPAAPDAFVEILPIFSGYRDGESKQVHLPVSYAEFYKQLPPGDWDQFKKVIPLAKISVAGEYDPAHFEAFANNARASSGTARSQEYRDPPDYPGSL